MQKDYNTTTCAQAGCFGQINKNGHFMLPALKIEFLFFKKSQASFIAHMKPSIFYKILYKYILVLEIIPYRPRVV